MAVPARRVGSLPAPRRAARRPALRLVRSPKRARRMPFAVLAVVLVAGLILLLTSAQALVAQGAFTLSELQERVHRLEVQNDFLQLREARASSPERIAEAARRGGLVPPSQREVLDG